LWIEIIRKKFFLVKNIRYKNLKIFLNDIKMSKIDILLVFLRNVLLLIKYYGRIRVKQKIKGSR